MYKEERANYFFLFSVNGSPIPLAAQTKYLIVTFDSSLIHTSNLIHQQSLRTLPSIYIYILETNYSSHPAPQHPSTLPTRPSSLTWPLQGGAFYPLPFLTALTACLTVCWAHNSLRFLHLFCSEFLSVFRPHSELHPSCKVLLSSSVSLHAIRTTFFVLQAPATHRAFAVPVRPPDCLCSQLPPGFSLRFVLLCHLIRDNLLPSNHPTLMPSALSLIVFSSLHLKLSVALVCDHF